MSIEPALVVPYRRTSGDRLRCGWKVARYALTEPLMLRLARWRQAGRSQDNQNPLISIMMPTFKRADLLEQRTIPPILNQTYKNFEVIIVGDRRIDDTEERIRALNDPRFRFVHVPEEAMVLPKDPKRRWFLGGAIQRNVGLGEARGEWIAEMDDDDVLTPDHLEALLRFAQQHDYEFVSAMYERERNGVREIIDVKDLQPRIGGIETWMYRSYLKMFRYNYDCWRKAYNCPQEIDRQLRMHAAGVRVGFLEKVVTLVLPLPGMQTVGLDALEIRTGQKLR